jgi:hypothetical protein
MQLPSDEDRDHGDCEDINFRFVFQQQQETSSEIIVKKLFRIIESRLRFVYGLLSTQVGNFIFKDVSLSTPRLESCCMLYTFVDRTTFFPREVKSDFIRSIFNVIIYAVFDYH